MYNAQFKTEEAAERFLASQIEQGIDAWIAGFDGEFWIVRTIET
jgi:hypothetical protein